MTRDDCLLALKQEIALLNLADGVVCHANTQITNDEDIILCFDHPQKQLVNWNSFTAKELSLIIAANKLTKWLAFRMMLAQELFDDHEPT